jgi:hypothetical protein
LDAAESTSWFDSLASPMSARTTSYFQFLRASSNPAEFSTSLKRYPAFLKAGCDSRLRISAAAGRSAGVGQDRCRMQRLDLRRPGAYHQRELVAAGPCYRPGEEQARKNRQLKLQSTVSHATSVVKDHATLVNCRDGNRAQRTARLGIRGRAKMSCSGAKEMTARMPSDG